MNQIPPLNREPIYAALFAFWAGLTLPDPLAVPPILVPAFKIATRNTKVWDQVPPEECPALLMQQRRETANRRTGLPTIWTLDVILFVFVWTAANTDTTIIPSQILNPLLDAIEGALVIDDLNNNRCTLGGLVSHCAISGAIEIFQGDLGDREVATIPLQILVSPQ